MRILFALLCCLVSIAATAAETLIVKNVHGYSLAANRVEPFSAMVIIDGKVDRLIQRTENVPAIAGADIINGEGRTLLPGLIDAHGHVLSLGQQRLQVDLRDSESLQTALNRVKKFAAENKNNRWILGRGWNQVLWADKKFPTATQLDTVVTDRPTSLARVDGHAIWVNSTALKLASISRDTLDPSGGQIVRDASGNPTGVFIDAAKDLVEKKIPPQTDTETKRALEVALRELAALGLTGVHDAGVTSHTYELYRSLAREGRLPIRVYAMLSNNKEALEVIKVGPKPAEFDDRLQMRAVKAYADGALGSRGAAMLDDYSDQPHHRGLMITSRDELRQLAALTAKYGWQFNVHAIGDAGNRAVLDAVENGMTAEQRQSLRPRIEHAQVISLADIPRFAKLNVIASIQPTHATSDMNMAEDRIGAERIKGAYAWRKLTDAGARLAGGSDFPVELANPFYGLYAAVTRKSRDGKPPNGWYGQEKLSREEALRLFTVDAAYAGHMEKSLGSLQPGQWADFTLIDRDYFTIPEDQIDDSIVVATYVAGKRVFPR
ncbi:MAG TPA: amidohydrolase [Steroidobacteraceae bacterium]|nr:amidohydrolase [Steroidobacteraceae bacterium]